MSHVVIHSRVDSDGILRVEVPVGMAEAEQIVQVTVDSLTRPTTRDEWEQFVRSTGGTITDASFVRHPEGTYEVREQLP
jgi:hypothetical protein